MEQDGLHRAVGGRGDQEQEGRAGRALAKVVVERLWRTVQSEEVYWKDDETPRQAMQGCAQCFVRSHSLRPPQALGYQTSAAVSCGAYV